MNTGHHPEIRDHLSLKQWPASELRFVYCPLIEPEHDILWSHTVARLHRLSTKWISLYELLVSIITQLAHVTVNHKSDLVVLSQHNVSTTKKNTIYCLVTRCN